MNYEYISWNHFYRLCGILYRKIDALGYSPDLIIAIARGGYPVGRVIADFFDIMDLVSLKVEHYHGPEKQSRAVIPYPLPLQIHDRRVLLIDDVSDSGGTFDMALRHLDEHGQPAALRTAVLHHKLTSSYMPDFYAQRIVKWRWITYPWAVVEDLTAIVSRTTPVPSDLNNLKRRLAEDFDLGLPISVIDQIAPIVLQRLNDAH